VPKRTDEWWQSKDGLGYCVKHKRYYLAEIGCQLCGYDNQGKQRSEDLALKVDVPKLFKCIACENVSLLFDEKTSRYQCMNKKCLEVYTQEEIINESKGSSTRSKHRINDTSYRKTAKKIERWRARLFGN
jgi:hypothetical protein